jgi:hypothetical protein
MGENEETLNNKLFPQVLSIFYGQQVTQVEVKQNIWLDNLDLTFQSLIT